MKKNTMRGIVILAIVAAAFTVVAFALPFAKNGVFALSLAFGLAAIALQFYVFSVAFHGDGSVRSKFYGIPVIHIGLIYMAVQLVLSLLFICLAAGVPIALPLVLYVVLLGAAAVGLIAADTMRDEITRQDVKLEKNVSVMRTLQSKVSALPGITADENLKKELAALSEAFRYSDPVSSDALAEVESNLAAMVDELQKAVVDGDAVAALSLVKSAAAILSERNRLCKLNK